MILLTDGWTDKPITETNTSLAEVLAYLGLPDLIYSLFAGFHYCASSSNCYYRYIYRPTTHVSIL